MHLPVFDIAGLGVSKNDILVRAFAPYIKEHQKLMIPHGHSFYHIVYFTQGGGSHTIDFESFDVKANQIYFMTPGQVHHWDFKGEVDGYVMNFSESFFQSFLLRPDYLDDFGFFRGATNESVVELPTGIQPKIKGIFEEMIRLRNSINPKNIDHLRILALELFMNVEKLNDKSEKEIAPHNQFVLRNFKLLIEKNYKQFKLPKEYASLLYITPNYLNALCNDVLGISAGEMIRNRVILEAKRLLVNLDLPVANIAYELNFADNSYFSKFFKKHVGVTPEEFRKGTTA